MGLASVKCTLSVQNLGNPAARTNGYISAIDFLMANAENSWDSRVKLDAVKKL